MKEISSVQNPLIKQILQLKDKSRERKKQKLFVVEGLREISLALKGGYDFEYILFYEGILSPDNINSFLSEFSTEAKLISISKEVYQKLAYRETTEGVIGLGRSKEHQLDSLNFKKDNPLILIAEAPEKPGNIGALLRTADAANLDAVIIANPKTDIYNPNIIRSSVGCVFTNKVVSGSTPDIIEFLKNNKIQIYCAALSASKNYHQVDFRGPSAIVVGTEATGLGEEWLSSSSQNIIIPMQGEIDSMNVSVSAAILIFEAKRQRNFS
ncbi:TrmH family RNA methyltransferase [Leptobacterium flavescens]|uniref:TrmH family RNA methyltransferase n=1 Tax=Leptobacterium flavescens TaxID=472055 RepID=UPI00293BCE46|nr:RNA methyltransferase [Leptobacterium flavescens]